MTAIACDKVDQLIDGVENLPPSPTLMIELLNLLKKPDRDLDQLVEVMSHDPSLTTEILRRCNTALFGQTQPATDIFEATFRLGFHEVYRIATGLFGSRLLTLPAAGSAAQLEALWEHSAVTGVVAGALAKESGEDSGVAFTGGLLHVLGRVVLLCTGSRAYAEAVRDAASEGDLLQVERELFSVDHMEVGSRLLSRWGFPHEIIEPIGHYQCPSEAIGHERLAAIVNLAATTAYDVAGGPSKPSPIVQAYEFSVQVLKFDDARLAGVAESVRQEAERIRGLFGTKATRSSSPRPRA